MCINILFIWMSWLVFFHTIYIITFFYSIITSILILMHIHSKNDKTKTKLTVKKETILRTLQILCYFLVNYYLDGYPDDFKRSMFWFRFIPIAYSIEIIVWADFAISGIRCRCPVMHVQRYQNFIFQCSPFLCSIFYLICSFCSLKLRHK